MAQFKLTPRRVLLLCIGGIAGTLVRYLIGTLSLVLVVTEGFPVNILVVNVLGSFVFGLFSTLAKSYDMRFSYSLVISVGFCGSLTTMSSCVLQTVALWRQREGVKGTVILLLNVLLSFFSVWIGMVVADIVANSKLEAPESPKYEHIVPPPATDVPALDLDILADLPTEDL